MADYRCPNCGTEFSQDEVENEDGVIAGSRSSPYTGMSKNEYYCQSCVEEYEEDTNLLRKVIKGNHDKLDFKLRQLYD